MVAGTVTVVEKLVTVVPARWPAVAVLVMVLVMVVVQMTEVGYEVGVCWVVTATAPLAAKA